MSNFEKDMQLIEEAAAKGEFIVYTLVDEEGVEADFEVVASCRRDNVKYYALVPVNPDENAEFIDFVVLKSDADSEDLVSIEDEEEEADVADYFNDLLTEFYSEEIDYDEK